MAISGANEVYKKISPLIEQQFPEHIRENGPRFVAFMEAYYEYLEKSGNAVNQIRLLNDNQDIDRTINNFVEYFRREFALSIPKTALADKRLIVKHIREFYRSRGSQKSFKFLFHILFKNEVNFYYPGEDILRVSDGRWVRETVLTCEPNTGNLNLMDGRLIRGTTSGTTGRVQNIEVIFSLGIKVHQLTIENLTGDFSTGEIIDDDYGNTAIVRAATGGLNYYQLTNGGAFNVKGDNVSLIGQSSFAQAEAIVTKIETSHGLTYKISKGGTGYRTGEKSEFTFSNVPQTITPKVRVTSLSNTQTISVFTDKISSLQNVVLNGNLPSSNIGLSFSFLGSNSTTLGSNLASATVYTTLLTALTIGTAVVGTINAISILLPGDGYKSTTLPSVTVIDADIANQQEVSGNANFGKDAVIIPELAPGAISELIVTYKGIDFILGEKIKIYNGSGIANTTTLDDSTSPGIRRHVLNTPNLYEGNAIVTGVTGTRVITGRYVGTKGFLSWNNKIQDSDYYQEFSYVLKSQTLVDKYRDVVQELLHAAGTKMFGLYEIISVPDMSIITSSSVSNMGFESDFLPYMLEDNTGYLRIENYGSRFTLEQDTTESLLDENGTGSFIINELNDPNFVSYIEQEMATNPAGNIAIYKIEAITATGDRYVATIT